MSIGFLKPRSLLKRILEIQNSFCFCKVAVIFTDGVQTQSSQNPINPGYNAQKLKDKNVRVFSVGAGDADPLELLSMATGPSYVIVVDLENLDRAVDKITAEICKTELTVRKLLLLFRGVY